MACGDGPGCEASSNTPSWGQSRAGARCVRAFTPKCKKGVDAKRGVFVQRYGSTDLDASLLLIALVGFLPPEDPRIRATVEAIERELVVDGLVLRYRPKGRLDGLPPGEGFFLPCSFWLADNLALLGRWEEAEALFERLLALRNDVGLLSEEYDLRNRRALGNMPQALTHVALINTARNLSKRGGPSEHRSGGMAEAPPGGQAPRHHRDPSKHSDETVVTASRHDKTSGARGRKVSARSPTPVMTRGRRAARKR